MAPAKDHVADRGAQEAAAYAAYETVADTIRKRRRAIIDAADREYDGAWTAATAQLLDRLGVIWDSDGVGKAAPDPATAPPGDDDDQAAGHARTIALDGGQLAGGTGPEAASADEAGV